MRIQQHLERGLVALAGAASGNRAFTAQHLADFLGLVLPLLGSPLVGEGAAFEAVRSLAQCLPGVLGKQGLSVARALRLVELDSRGCSPKRSLFCPWGCQLFLGFVYLRTSGNVAPRAKSVLASLVMLSFLNFLGGFMLSVGIVDTRERACKQVRASRAAW